MNTSKKFLTFAILALTLSLGSCGSTDSVDAEVAFDHLDRIEYHFDKYEGVTPHEQAGFIQSITPFQAFRPANGQFDGERIEATDDLVQAAKNLETVVYSVLDRQAFDAAKKGRHRLLVQMLTRMFVTAAGYPLQSGPVMPVLD